MLRSQNLFRLILLAYPREFRREYGPDMAQVFRDCYRAEKRTGDPRSLWRLWLHTLVDLIRTAPKEHLEKLGEDSPVMNNLRKDALALLGCIGIIVIAFLLLAYGRKHEVTSILLIGRSLDALVTAGVVGNLIVFMIVKATRLNPLRTAFWALLSVNAVLFLVATLIGSRVDPQFSLGSVLIAYVVSFLFWYGLHFIWAKSKGSGQLAVSSGNNH
jgi:hypothetical protein